MRANIGPPAKRHLNGVRLRADDGPILNAGLVALCFFRGSGKYCYVTLYFCDFSGGGGGGRPLFPSLDPPM